MKDKQLAIELLDKTFNCDFNTERYSRFIKELFNQFDIKQKERHAWSEFKSHIDTYQLLGSYTDSSKKSIDVLAVKLKRTSSIDRARTKQRNFVAKYLVDYNKDAALVAFYGYDRQDWRFSFVKLDYHLEKEESGKVKPVEELTPAKRYSYLVGVNEPNHTCRSQFLDLIIEEVKNPSIEEIEAAFSIDNVTKVFFSEYNDLFLKLKESLDKIIEKHPHVKEEFDKKNISTVDFSKKLLGQIVFIYFLQKKGWLGVGKDKETGKFKEWGEGPKKFLRKLFDKEIIGYDKFFNEILEPLFYEALSKEYDHNFYSRFDCKIPFLNGGLFEPINDYDWVNVKIPFENKIFEDILETFDRFNFTVKEDEPLDKEVAVDPEMLGKVFENLLTVTDRKSKGAFYTPREIVHYMCQQSLINYLATNTDVPLGDIETFIQYGELAQQISNKIEVEEKYIPASIKKNHNKINDLLKDIKIVDPAVGSGAFPMGMMNEIVKARSILSWLSEDDKPNYYDLKRETIENCLYGVDIDSSAVDITKLRFWLSLVVDETDIKKIKPLPNLDHRIMCGNSLLEEFEGVKLFDEQLLEVIPETDDFELGQVDAEIERFYLELGEIHTGKRKDNGRKKEIETELKKLDRKKKAILSGPKDETQQSTFNTVLEIRRKESQKKLAELKRLQKAFFNEQGRKRKRKLAEDIDIIEWELVEETLKEQGNEDAMQKLAQYKKNRSKPFFLWKLYFSDVFQRENPGFDVVIANPPYIGQKGNKEIFRTIKDTSLGKKFHQRRMDIFYFFFHMSLDLTRTYGQIAFITTNYYLTATYADKLRDDFSKRGTIQKIINFNELKIFESALGQHNLITILRKGFDNNFRVKTSITNRLGVASEKILKKILNESDEETEYYYVKQNELYDKDNGQIRLFKSSDSTPSTVDLILDKIKEMGIELGSICELNQGIVTGADKLSKSHIGKYCVDGEKDNGIFVLSDEEKNRLLLTPNEAGILKPWFKNSDVYKWYTDTSNSKYLIYYTSKGGYGETPNLDEHFLKYKHILINRNVRTGFVTLDEYDLFVKGEKNISYVMISSAFKRGDFYCISYARDERIFNSAKIVVPQRSSSNIFGYNESPWFASADVYFITQDNPKINLKYVLSLLNSKLYYVWLYNRGKRKGEYLELYLIPLSEIPIKEIPLEKQTPFINLVDQILSITSAPDYRDSPQKQSHVQLLESQIDQLVYKLYDLTPEEIEIVEGFNKGK